MKILKVLSAIALASALFLSLVSCNSQSSKNESAVSTTLPAGIIPVDACGVWCWYSTGGAPNKWDGKISDEETYPGMRGIPIVVGWNELEPEDGIYNWNLIDDIIKKADEYDKYVFTLLWLNPVNPEWLYEKGVPKVEIESFKRDPNFSTLPYPMDEKYKFYSERIITKLAEHLRSLPPDLFERIVFHQVVEGSTGDGFCYKGDPVDPKYNVSRDEWAEYQKYIRKFTVDAFTEKDSGLPEIPLLIHLMTDGDMTWGAEQYEGFLTKKGVASHFYNSNDSRSKSLVYEPYNTPENELGRPVYSRGEGETMWMREWFKKDSLQNLYWSAFHALHWGLDIWNIPDHILAEPRWYPALDVFNKYAGNKFPGISPYAFAALKDQLNADDTIRFPENIYGVATKTNTERVLKICSSFADHGAIVEDLDLSLAGSHSSRARRGYNDVGWDRIDTDYRMYLYSIDQVETSVGWWHIGPKESPYGRFARGFEHSTGKDTLFFKFHKDFFPGNGKKVGNLKFRIVWLDNNKGSWKFVYDAGGREMNTAAEFSGMGTGKWREELITVKDAIMDGNGPRASDIVLINTDNLDNIFHIIEVERIVEE
ncbi:MAG: beta-galactosidase [Bacteroidales bacterium]|nr:beta-galactosidase [Bacteroidales bacterium]MCF8389330.1 beta-galactosidase [Bacteroidales bacterium]